MNEVAATISSAQELILNLQNFEGPLDLLLHMIRQHDIDIFDIPIHQIADEFQQYVEWFQIIDLDRAGEYLALSAELLYIKSKMLLPPPEEDAEDPRKDLVDRLVAYQQVQSAAKFLHKQQQLGRDIFKRGLEPASDIPSIPLTRPDEIDAPDLLTVFQNLLKRRLRITGTHQVRRGKVSVRARIKWLCEQLLEVPKQKFSELLDKMDGRPTIIATFLAVLELSRLNRIKLTQVDGIDIEIEAVGSMENLNIQSVSSFSYNNEAEPVEGENENEH